MPARRRPDGRLLLACHAAAASSSQAGELVSAMSSMDLQSLEADAPDVLVAKPLPKFTTLAAAGDSLAAYSGAWNSLDRRPSDSQRQPRVRFKSEVEVWETHSAADYPARSMLSPFDPELEMPLARSMPEATDGLLLSTILQQRDATKLPNLTQFWSF